MIALGLQMLGQFYGLHRRRLRQPVPVTAPCGGRLGLPPAVIVTGEFDPLRKEVRRTPNA